MDLVVRKNNQKFLILLGFFSVVEYFFENLMYMSLAFFIIHIIFSEFNKILLRKKLKNKAKSSIPENLRDDYDFINFSTTYYPSVIENDKYNKIINYSKRNVFTYRKNKKSFKNFPDFILSSYHEKENTNKNKPFSYFYFWDENNYKSKKETSSPSEYYFKNKRSPFDSSEKEFLEEFEIKNKKKNISFLNDILIFIILAPLSFYFELNFGFLFFSLVLAITMLIILSSRIFKKTINKKREEKLEKIKTFLPKNIINNFNVDVLNSPINLELFSLGSKDHYGVFKIELKDNDLFENKELIINNDFHNPKYRYQLIIKSKERIDEIINGKVFNGEFNSIEDEEIYKKDTKDEELLSIILENGSDPLNLNNHEKEKFQKKLEEKIEKKERMKIDMKKEREKRIREHEKKEQELKKQLEEKKRLEQESCPVFIYNKYIDTLLNEHNNSIVSKKETSETDGFEFPSYLMDKESSASMAHKFKIIYESEDEKNLMGFEDSHFKSYEKMKEKLEKYGHSMKDLVEKY